VDVLANHTDERRLDCIRQEVEKFALQFPLFAW